MGAQTPQKKHGSPDPKALVMEEKNMGAQTPKFKKNMGAQTPKLKKNMGAQTPKQNMGAQTPRRYSWKPRPQKIHPRGLSIEELAWTPETETP